MSLISGQPDQGDGVALAFTSAALAGDDTTTAPASPTPDSTPAQAPANTADLFFQSDAAASLTPPPQMPPNLPTQSAGAQAPGAFGPQAPVMGSGGAQAQGGGAGNGDSTAALNQQLMQDMAALDASLATSQTTAAAQQSSAGPSLTQAPAQQATVAPATTSDTATTPAPAVTAEQPSQPASPFATTGPSAASISPASLGSQALAFETNQGQSASGQFLAQKEKGTFMNAIKLCRRPLVPEQIRLV